MSTTLRSPGGVADLERALAALNREHQAVVAGLQHHVGLLWTIAVPRWLADALAVAESSGWIVERRLDAVVFHRPETGDHSFIVQMPLPESEDDVHRIKAELRMRLGYFADAAAST